METFGPLVSPEWLAEHLDDPDLRIIDFRWYLDGRDARALYQAAHIPGAVFVDLTDVSAPTGPGRHPIPPAEQFAAAMREAGVSSATRVVAYDDAKGSVAARLWWLLRHFGHPQAAILDGGLQAWPGQPTSEVATPVPGDFVAREPLDAGVLDYQAVRDRAPGTVLIDARAGDRYRGEVEPVDRRPGHIPGAISAPWAGNVGEDGRLLPAEELRNRYAALGIEDGPDTVVYCGSGVTATHDLLAMEIAGLTGARLYEGSWSDWSSRPELPAATGPEPQ